MDLFTHLQPAAGKRALLGLNRGWEVVGIREGYNGLLAADRFPYGGLVQLTADVVRGITRKLAKKFPYRADSASG